MLQPCKSCFACLPSIPWCLPAIKTFPYVAGGEPPHTRLFPYVARLLSLDILGSSRMSRGSSPSTYSALPVCRAAPLPRHTRLFPYVTGGRRHILGSSRMSRGSSPSTYSALPVCYGRGAATYSAPPVCRAPLPVCRGFLPATFSALDIRHCIPSLFYIHLVL